MKEIRKILCVGVAGLTILAQDQPASSAKATEQQEQVKISSSQLPEKPAISACNKASTVIGMAIKDSSGKDLGKVQDLVFDLENGKLGYAVIALGGDRFVPVPFTALKPAESKDHLILNMSSSVLAAASGVKNDELPALDAFAVGGPAGAEKGQGSSSRSDDKK